MSAGDNFRIQQNTPLGDEIVEKGACEEKTRFINLRHLHRLRRKSMGLPPPKPNVLELDEPLWEEWEDA